MYRGDIRIKRGIQGSIKGGYKDKKGGYRV